MIVEDQLTELKSKLGKQSHVLNFWEELSDAERKILISQIKKIDVESLENGLKNALNRKDNCQVALKDISPLDSSCIIVREDLSNEHQDKLYNLGKYFLSR